LVTNLETIQKYEDTEMFNVINGRANIGNSFMIIYDEAHFLKNNNSAQTK